MAGCDLTRRLPQAWSFFFLTVIDAGSKTKFPVSIQLVNLDIGSLTRKR